MQAYDAAAADDMSVLHELNELFSAPYDEQSAEMHEKYFRKWVVWCGVVWIGWDGSVWFDSVHFGWVRFGLGVRFGPSFA